VNLHPTVVYKNVIAQLVDTLRSGSSLNSTLVRQDLLKHFIRCRLKLAFNIVTGMAFIHSKGGVHRDLKLANILIYGDGNDGVYILLAKLCDFGISSFKNYFPAAQLYSIKTISSMAPENFDGQNPIDTKSEVFSFAIILWELYCLSEAKYQYIDGVEIVEKNLEQYVSQEGRLPLPLPTQINIQEYEVCKLVTQLIMQCWHSNPTARPTFDQILNYFRKHLMVDNHFKEFNYIPAPEQLRIKII